MTLIAFHRDRLGCFIHPGRDREGIEIIPTRDTPVCESTLRVIQAEREQMEQRYHALLQEHMQCGLTITRLEAQLAEHLAFMDRFRSSLKQEEHGSQP